MFYTSMETRLTSLQLTICLVIHSSQLFIGIHSESDGFQMQDYKIDIVWCQHVTLAQCKAENI